MVNFPLTAGRGSNYNRIVNFSCVVRSQIRICVVQLHNVIVQTPVNLALNVSCRIFPSHLQLQLVNLSEDFRTFHVCVLMGAII